MRPEQSSHPAFVNQIFDFEAFQRQPFAELPNANSSGLGAPRSLFLSSVPCNLRQRNLFQRLIEELIQALKATGSHQFRNPSFLFGLEFYRHTLKLVEHRPKRNGRVLAVKRGNEFYWFWIGPHDEYERIVND